MPDAQEMAALVRQAYGVEVMALEPVGNDPTGERATYHAALGDGREVMLRGYRMGSRMPFWFGGGPAEEWLRERARVLGWLARRDYPAPRVVAARNGNPLATAAGYSVLGLTYLAGQPLRGSADHVHVRRLASALGRLHALAEVPGSEVETHLPASWWYPLERAVAPLRDQLAGVRADVPARWQPLHADFVATLDALRGRDDLPLAAIHGDCYPENAILNDTGQVVLIDWDCSGQGAAVLDLGTLLLDTQPDTQLDPAAGAPVVVNPELVGAIVAGYREWREPSALEREALRDATRFGVAFIGALRFAWAREQGWGERIERSLRRLRARYAAADEVARWPARR